ncbi:unnamed protein product [Microthlaspi erraticum]|uniref:Uncharacterized protein n=1 Tax=Microthlaspi erraticum TaxID=1685480 RepID=A0A6D2HPE2_9BRAS|nr:unnamed protein product [Microthlaspi erraticum]
MRSTKKYLHRKCRHRESQTSSSFPASLSGEESEARVPETAAAETETAIRVAVVELSAEGESPAEMSLPEILLLLVEIE